MCCSSSCGSSSILLSRSLPAHMFRAPDRHQRSPGAPRPPSGWGFPRSPYRGSSRGYSPYSPGSPGYSPGSNRGYRDGSPAGFGNGSRGFGDSPAAFGSGLRGFGGPMRRRGDGFRRPQSLSPTSAPNFKVRIRGWTRTGSLIGTDDP